MSIASLTASAPPPAHRAFVAELPRIDNVLRFAFRHLPRHRRDEAVADGRAAAWHAWAGLARRGRDPLEVGPAGIAANAANAARYVRRGRRLGTGCRAAGADVYERRAQAKAGFSLFSLDSTPGADGAGASWRDWSAAGNRCTPADEACFRLDFAEWMGRLPERKRRAAELFAEGHATGEVARQLGVTPGAVSQARAWLCASWRAFHGDSADVATVTISR